MIRMLDIHWCVWCAFGPAPEVEFNKHRDEVHPGWQDGRYLVLDWPHSRYHPTPEPKCWECLTAQLDQAKDDVDTQFNCAEAAEKRVFTLELQLANKDQETFKAIKNALDLGLAKKAELEAQLQTAKEEIAELKFQNVFEQQFADKLKEFGTIDRLIEQYSASKMKVRDLESQFQVAMNIAESCECCSGLADFGGETTPTCSCVCHQISKVLGESVKTKPTIFDGIVPFGG